MTEQKEAAILAKVDSFELGNNFLIIDCMNPADRHIKITVHYTNKQMKDNIEDIMCDRNYNFRQKMKYILQYIKKEQQINN